MEPKPWAMPGTGIATANPREVSRYLVRCIFVVQSRLNRDRVIDFFYLVGMADGQQWPGNERHEIDDLVVKVAENPESETSSAIERMNSLFDLLPDNADPRRKSSEIADAWKKSKRLREGTEAKRMGEALQNQRRDETTPSVGLKDYHLRVDVRHEKKLNVAKYKICFTVPGRAQHGRVDNLVRYAATSGMVYQTVNSELRQINGTISIKRCAVLYDRKSASDWDHVRRTTAVKDLQATDMLQLVNTTSKTFSIAAIQETIDGRPLEPVLFGLSHPRKVSECLRKTKDPKYDALRSAIQLSVYNGASNSLESITSLENILKEKRFALIQPSPPNSVLPSSYSTSIASQSHSSNLAGTSLSLTSTEFGELIRRFPSIPQFTGTLPTTEPNTTSVYYSTHEGSNSTSRTGSYHSLVETLGQHDVTSNDGQELVTGSSPSVTSIPVPDPYPVTVSFPLPLPVAPSPPSIHPVSSGRVPYSPPTFLNPHVASLPVPDLRSGTSDSVPSWPSAPSGHAPDSMSITNRRAPNPVPSSRVPNTPIASGRMPDSHPGTSNSVQSRPSITSSHTPSAPGDHRSNSPVPSGRVSSRHPGTSDSASVPSRSSTPGGRVSDPMSITNRRALDSVLGSGVSSSAVASRRGPDLDSGRSDSVRSPSITGGHTPYTPSVRSGPRSNSPVPSGRASGPHSGTSDDHVPYSPSLPSGRRSNSPVPSGRASGPHSGTSNSAPSRPSTLSGRTPGLMSNTSHSSSRTSSYHSLAETLGQPEVVVFPNSATPNDAQEMPVMGSSPSVTNIPVPNPYPVTQDPVQFPLPLPALGSPDSSSVTTRRVPDLHPVAGKPAPNPASIQPVSSSRVPYSSPAPSSRILNSPGASRPVPGLRSGTSDSVPSQPSTPSGHASEPMSITNRSAPNPVPSSRVPNAHVASGRVPDSTSGTRNSVQPRPSIPSRRTPDPMAATIRRVPDSELGSRSPNPPAVSRHVRDPGSGTSDPVPSSSSIPGGRSPDPMSITSRRVPDSAPDNGVPSSGAASRRVPDLDSGRSDSIQSVASPSIASFHTPYTTSTRSGRRSNSPVSSGRVSSRHPETRDAVPSRPSTPSGRAPESTSSTSRSASSSHPVTSNPISTTPPITGRRASGLPSVASLRAPDSPPVTNRRNPNPLSVQETPVPNRRPPPVAPALDLTPAQATLDLSSPSGPTFPTSLSADIDPAPVAETPVNIPATRDEEGPVGFVNSVISTSHPLPSPSNSAVSLATNPPVASTSTPRDIGAIVVGSRENLESPSTTSHESQNTNQSATGTRFRKRDWIVKTFKKIVGMSP